MPALRIDLQSGFAGDSVVIDVAGRTVYDERAVSTDYSIGRADSVAVEVKPGAQDVEVRLPERRLTRKLAIDVKDRDVHAAVSVDGSEITFRLSDEPFQYF
jgi:hypothetical protein